MTTTPVEGDPQRKVLQADERHRFVFHPATPATGPRHDAVRAAAIAFAERIAELVPDGRHRALALTAVQEAMMWANAAIACDTYVSEAAHG